jgi:exosortase A-associated hydrolase 1
MIDSHAGPAMLNREAERALVFRLGDEDLLGIVHPGAADARRGVLVVVGGPQYRVGSHRQFLLLARHLAAAGVPVLRFDYRGMGDSSGARRDFERVAEDLRAAIDAFMAEQPQLREIVIWGLCDAASAALMYAGGDERVSGLVLLNPWVRTEEGLAKAYLKHYYLSRITSRDFWAGLLRGRLNPVAAARGLWQVLGKALGRGAAPAAKPAPGVSQPAHAGSLPLRMAAGWQGFRGRILLILSGDDLTAAEFRDAAANLSEWRGLLEQARVRRCDLAEANHTFSRRAWRDQVAQWTLEWVERPDAAEAMEIRQGGRGGTA